ncbi:MAG: hypothetical protein ACRDKY_09760 [Solirubrobacteraceae bacterium]
MTRTRPFIVIGVVLLAAAGVIGAIAYFNARDDATVSTTEGPGRERPAGERPVVRPGNVLLVYSEAQLARPLLALQRELSGTDKALVAAGQAVIVRRNRALPVPVTGLSARHRLDASRAELEALRDFVEYWLGRETG